MEGEIERRSKGGSDRGNEGGIEGWREEQRNSRRKRGKERNSDGGMEGGKKSPEKIVSVIKTANSGIRYFKRTTNVVCGSAVDWV